MWDMAYPPTLQVSCVALMVVPQATKARKAALLCSVASVAAVLDIPGRARFAKAFLKSKNPC